MKITSRSIKTVYFFILILCLFIGRVDAEVDLLPSWAEGPTKVALLQFVKETTQKGGEHYIPVEERIATFDEDGTLWVEQPLSPQLFFAVDSVKEFASQHPEWKEKEPFKSILDTGNLETLQALSPSDIEKIIAEAYAGMSVREFQTKVHDWLKTTLHPRYKRPFTELSYQPMLELLHLFQEHGFKTYIVSGSDQEFIRVYAEKLYGIPPEQVIGSTGKTGYAYEEGQPVLKKLPEVLFIDDETGKPESINLIIGRRPFAAFGNSIGDQQMLEWTQAGVGKRFELLVHHDDAVREYAYGKDSKVGNFSAALMQEAKARGWFVVSMKNDWKVLFSWQNP